MMRSLARDLSNGGLSGTAFLERYMSHQWQELLRDLVEEEGSHFLPPGPIHSAGRWLLGSLDE
jgi:hypothetical protein